MTTLGEGRALDTVIRRTKGVVSDLRTYAFQQWLPQYSFVLVSCAAFWFRLRLITRGVTVSPDGHEYLAIAENLVRNACFSASDPATAICQPTWSHHPPGYPILAAVVGSIGPEPSMAVALAQTTLFCLALWYVMRRAAQLRIGAAYVICGGLMVALSPVTAGWSRWVLPETMAATACLWLLAECLNSLATRRVSVWRFSAAIAGCALTRWDMIWVAVPFVIVTWRVLGTRRSFRTVVAVGLLSALPYLAWITRAAIAGLPPLPPTLPTVEDVPPGVQDFWRATAIKQTAVLALIWPIWSQKYSEVAFHPDAFMDEPYHGTAAEFVRELAGIPVGVPVPIPLDMRLAAAARDYQDEGLRRTARIFLRRFYYLWMDRDVLFEDGYRTDVRDERLLHLAASPLRVLPLGLVLFALVRLKSGSARAILAGLLLFVFVRTVFLTGIIALEIRYLVPSVPALEFAGVALWGFRCRHTVSPVGRAETRGVT